MTKMRWGKKPRHTYEKPLLPEEHRARRCREDSHQRLVGAPTFHPQIITENITPPPEPAAETLYSAGTYRAVGSAMWKDGHWYALDRNGEVLGEFETRWEAWREADKLGMERVTYPPAVFDTDLLGD